MDMESKIDQILKIVTISQQDIAGLKRDVATLKEDVAILKKDVAELKERVTKLEQRVTSLERSVFLLETQQGDKINALFDARKSNEDAHKRIEQSIADLKSEIQVTLFNHEKRISNLEGNLVPVL